MINLSKDPSKEELRIALRQLNSQYMSLLYEYQKIAVRLKDSLPDLKNQMINCVEIAENLSSNMESTQNESRRKYYLGE